jgi:hypothetical protein
MMAHYAQDGVGPFLYFEIEYRTSRPIERDSNSLVGWTQVLI